MAQLLDIQKVVIGPDSFTATVRVSEGVPLSTSENVEATARVYWLMPEIAGHVCVGDGGSTFQDVMGDTNIVHLMEHVTLELLARTNMAGDLSNARTRATSVDRVYEIELACPDDVLVASALSSAGWIIQWAFGSADEESKPNVDAIVAGIVNLTSTSYTMEGNEAPLPGTETAAAEDGVVLAEEAAEEAAELADDAVADAVDAAPDALEGAEEEAEEDALAGLDLDLGAAAAEIAADALEEGDVRRAPHVVELGDAVGFMDVSAAETEDDPLA